MIPASAAFISANAALVKRPIYLITITGYARVFTSFASGVAGQYDWIESIDNLGITISDLDGGADQAQLSFTVQDRGGAITSDFPGFVFEGKTITLKTGYPGMAQTDFATLFTGVLDHVDSANFNQSYLFHAVDNRELLAQVVYTTGDDGQPTDSSHPHTLNDHPLNILLNVLETQLGISTSLIDVAGITAYRDGIFSGLQFVFTLTSAPPAKDFIENELLKALGGYLWTNSAGQFTVRFFYNSNPTPVLALADADMLEIPVAAQADLINVVTVRFDQAASSSSSSSSSNGFLAEDTEIDSPSVARYGQYGQQIIESQGMRSGFQGWAQAAFVARLIFLRYGFKTLKFDALPVLWKACLLEPGDIVSISNAYVPNRITGIIGISAAPFEVLDRTWNLTEGIVELTLLDASYLSSFGTFLFTPDGEADFTAASTTDKGKYMFLCADTDKYSDGTAGHVLG